jgi:hypothetical protein
MLSTSDHCEILVNLSVEAARYSYEIIACIMHGGVSVSIFAAEPANMRSLSAIRLSKMLIFNTTEI